MPLHRRLSASIASLRALSTSDFRPVQTVLLLDHGPERKEEKEEVMLGVPGRAESEGVIGYFRVGGQFRGQPERATSWRVVTESTSVAAELLKRLDGSRVVEGGADAAEGCTEIATGRDRVSVVLQDANAVSLRMVSRGADESFHVCDGSEYLEPRGMIGSSCGCLSNWPERKAAAASGRGPRPDAQMNFKLARAPQLGAFGLRSSSWEFVKQLDEVRLALLTAGGPTEAILRYGSTCFTTLSGIEVSYRKPLLELCRLKSSERQSLRLAA